MEDSPMIQPEDILCARCSQLDFDEILSISTNNDMPHYITNLGELSQDNEQMSCLVCRLFSAVAPANGWDLEQKDYALVSAPIPRLYGSGRGLYVLNIADANRAKIWQVQESGMKTGIIAFATPSQKVVHHNAFRARQIDSHQIDYVVIQGWLISCDNFYENGMMLSPWKSPSLRKLAELKLIHCKTRRIVSAPSRCRYSALSYVWGSDIEDDHGLSRNGKLPSLLPQTIEDALTVTEKIGLDFIWIDRYCIDQENQAEMHTQIQQMDQVYGTTYVTIIAAAGNGPHHGLPGVSKTPRIPQPSVRIGNQQLVSILPHPKKDIYTSAWNSRGWTLQESLFSRACLVFTDHQLYFECAGGIAFETIDSYSHVPDRSNLFLSHPIDTRGLKKFYALVKEYCDRNLSYEADGLRAFQGALNAFRDSPGFDTRDFAGQYFGIPIRSPNDSGDSKGSAKREKEQNLGRSQNIIAGLCWRSSGPGKRRTSFPSWTWAGWTSPLSSSLPECQNGLTFVDEQHPKLWMERHDGTLAKFDGCNVYHLPRETSTQFGNFIHIEAWTISLHVQFSPPGAREWMNNFRADDEWLEDSNYFAVFEDDKILVQLALYSPYYLNDGQTENSVSDFTQEKELLGLVLGVCENVSAAENTFIMIVRNHGSYFERIGHTIFSWKTRRVVHKQPRKVSDLSHPLEICFRLKERRCIRLG